MIQGMYQLITLISKSLSIKMYNFLNVTCNYCDPLSPREITTILNLMNHCLYLFNHFYHLCLNAKQRFYFFTYYINEIIYLLQLIFFLTSSVWDSSLLIHTSAIQYFHCQTKFQFMPIWVHLFFLYVYLGKDV